MPPGNLDPAVVADFGREWARFDQSEVPEAELRRQFEAYFSLFPWERLPAGARGFDLGCGSGRWARFVAERVGEVHCIDPSPEALAVARGRLADRPNCRFHEAGVHQIPLDDESMDFGYSLGVLHHVPDTAAGIRAAAAKLRPGAPLLLYLYYALDNRPAWFRAIWRGSDLVRRVVSRLPFAIKYPLSQAIAMIVYWPLARAARALERAGRQVEHLPLSAYRDKSFYAMRTDALDRFGTRLEQRFSRRDIEAMMQSAGLEQIRFREEPPFWCAVGLRQSRSVPQLGSSGLS